MLTDVYITHHAIERFRERIHHTSEQGARTAILLSLQHSISLKPLPIDGYYALRCSCPVTPNHRQFRMIISTRYPGAPQVVTVL